MLSKPIYLLISICSAFVVGFRQTLGNHRFINCKILSSPLNKDDKNEVVFKLPSVDDDDDEDGMDINLIAETVIDQSIERAVKQMLDEPDKVEEISPVEKFNAMYKVGFSPCKLLALT